MIFVTVGAQMPFDRLIQAVDLWASENPAEQVFAQVGPGGWQPRHVPFVEFLDPLEFRDKVEAARVVISHAGMGTILTALERGKPLLIMPRRGDLQETRNDHQVATARQLAALGRATVAYDAKELVSHLSRMARLAPPPRISDHASPELLAALRDFVLGGGNTDVASGSAEKVSATGAGSNSSGNGNGAGGCRAGFHLQGTRPTRAVAADGIGAAVLLAGGSGSGSLARAAERSVLELPVSNSETLLSVWRGQLESAFAHRRPDEPADVRILGGPLIRYDDRSGAGLLRLEHDHDPGELRGTGGLLHDVAAEYPDDAYLLVASASTLLLKPLGDLIGELRETGADVAFFVHDDRSSPNLMLVRAHCLRTISPVGFVDFKEQALPQIAADASVSAVRRSDAVGYAARTPGEYVRALRRYHAYRASGDGSQTRCASRGPFAERWLPLFSVVEDGAEVAAGATIADSVVLGRGRVGRGATVVRSIVCPGGVVAASATVVDQVVRPQNAKAIARAVGVGS